MNKKDVLLKIKNLPKEQFPKQKIIGWVNSMEGSVANNKPTKFKKGDVLMHPIFKHPYILAEFKKTYWVCMLLTSNGDCTEVIEPCNSRFFENSFITKTLFTVEEPIGGFCNVYQNDKQITLTLKKIKEILL